MQKLYLGGWVHEMEQQQILHSQRFEQQYDISQVGSLDLRHRGCQHLFLVLTVGVQTPALPGRGGRRV